MAGFLLHGPYFYLGFSKIDKKLGPATSWLVVLKKTTAAQCILFPPYLCFLFGLMGTLEGLTYPQIIEKMKQRVPETFVGGCVYWPVANSINFSLVPATLRVPYLAASAGVWNSYLSWVNQRGSIRTDSIVPTV
jgi:protein Mpv17